jgi:predicted  nucleic acid-binding Zn-ribbon protein
MGMARQLHQLQTIELDIESKEQALAQSEARLGESQALVEARIRLEKGQQHLDELKKKQHAAEWEVDDVADKLLMAQDTLYSGRIKNPKELASLQHEVEGFKRKRNSLEENTLEIMEQAEAATADLASLSRELGEVEDRWRNEQRQLSVAIEQLKSSLSQLKNERQTALAGIGAETIDCYNRLRKQKGLAVARVEQGTCRGCRISLSTAELQRVKGNKLIMCSSCGRILFID